ncbi:hypothetical protein B0J18DRAFT_266218 [Chaetomium sp. MPI-SDFR-AT-0129]|nr:hypothetical protein B0J18DRAFT_266218 [Chaetomium sp. MPI-SDFR-AT-0129]
MAWLREPRQVGLFGFSGCLLLAVSLFLNNCSMVHVYLSRETHTTCLSVTPVARAQYKDCFGSLSDPTCTIQLSQQEQAFTVWHSPTAPESSPSSWLFLPAFSSPYQPTSKDKAICVCRTTNNKATVLPFRAGSFATRRRLRARASIASHFASFPPGPLIRPLYIPFQSVTSALTFSFAATSRKHPPAKQKGA